MANLLSIIRQPSSSGMRIIRDGFDPVSTTGRTQRSIAAKATNKGSDILVEYTGHSDIQGAIFGLAPDETRPDAGLLSSWISAKGLSLDPDSLASQIFEEGTVRRDFGFYETTEPLIMKLYDSLVASDEFTDGVFDKLDQLLKN